MSNRYEIHDSGDGTFEVAVSGGIGVDAITPKFPNRKAAEDYVALERRRLGIDTRWRAVDE